jgi:hypothetical protein
MVVNLQLFRDKDRLWELGFYAKLLFNKKLLRYRSFLQQNILLQIWFLIQKMARVL